MLKFNIFEKNKIYNEFEIVDICKENNLITTDCIKDDNEITVAFNEEGEPSWDFVLINDRFSKKLYFKLQWSIFDD